MDYNPPKYLFKVHYPEEPILFFRVRLSNEPRKLGDGLYYHGSPHTDLFYKNDKEEEGLVELLKVGKKQNQLEWNSNSELIISDDLFNKHFTKENIGHEPTDILTRLNLEEYNKLIELLNRYTNQTKKPLVDDTTTKEALDTEIEQLNNFKSKFINWFYKHNVELPIAETIEPFDAALSLSPFQLEEITTVIQEQVEYLVMKARKDEREDAPKKWKNKISTIFSRNAHLGVIKRIMVKFNEKHPNEPFNINGMSWYKKKESK